MFGEEPRIIAYPNELIVAGTERHAAQKRLGDEILQLALKKGLKLPDLPAVYSPVSFGSTKESIFEIYVFGEMTGDQCKEIASEILKLITNTNIQNLDLEFYRGVKEVKEEKNVRYVKVGLISRFQFETHP
jgi:hypothetical protein